MPLTFRGKIGAHVRLTTRLPSTRALQLTLLALSFLNISCDRDQPCAPGRALLPLASERGSVTCLSFQQFRSGRLLSVYRPYGFSQANQYHIALVLDGETAFGGFGTLQIDRTADRLIADHVIPPVLIVGIHSAGPNREFEYTPSSIVEDGLVRGGGGSAFLDAICDTLLPLLCDTFSCGRNTTPSVSMIGVSLAGLLAVHAGLTRGETFAQVAALSPTYSWNGAEILTTARSSSSTRLTRWYQDTGTIDDNPYSLLVRMAAIADTLGFRQDCDIVSRQIDGGTHDAMSWSQRIPDVLELLLSQDLQCASAVRVIDGPQRLVGPLDRSWRSFP